jgi:nicotinamidase-related amidase
MNKKQFFLSFMFLCVSSTAFGGWESTFEYIQEVLKMKGRKVAILIVDMQYNFQMEFIPSEEAKVVTQQLHLLDKLSGLESVLAYVVRYPDQGETLPAILAKLRRQWVFKSFLKESGDAFKTVSALPGDEKGDLEGLIQGRLGDALRADGVTDVVPMGCYLSKCVAATLKGASREGFHVFF